MRIQKTRKKMNKMQWTFFDKSPLMSVQYLIFAIIYNIIINTNIDSTANLEFWYKKEITNNMRFAENFAQKGRNVFQTKK